MAIEQESGRLHNSLSEFSLPTPTAVSPPPPSPRSSSLQYSTHPPLRRSPFHSLASRNSSMATQRYNVRPESYFQTNPAFVRSSDYEISNDRELASSQPVSLIQLYTKTSSSRNRPRRVRASQSDTASEIAVFRGVDDSRPGLSTYSTSAEYGLRDEPRRASPPTRLVSQEYNWQRETHIENLQGQSRQPSQEDSYTQKNPLNYASNYKPSQSRGSSYISESPFLKRANSWDLPEFGAGPAGITLIPQLAMETPQSKPYSQQSHQKEYVPSSSLQLYRESFDRPHDKSPYESVRLKHRTNRTDLPEITSGLVYGNPANQDYEKPAVNTTIRSEPTFTTHPRERPPNTEVVTYSRGARETHKSQDSSSLSSRLSSSANSTQRTLKDEIYAILDNMNVESNTTSRPTTIHSSRDLQPTPASTHAEDQARRSLQQLSINVDSASEQRQSETLVRALQTVSARYEQQEKTRKTSDMALGQCDSVPNIAHFQASETPPKKEIRPPPGFTEFREPFLTKTLDARNERFREADAWFHQDSRGEEPLRRQIAEAAENLVSRSERLRGQPFSYHDRNVTKQTIGLLGGAITNLHAYRSCDQRDYFTSFRPVDSRYCAATWGGSHSYFEGVW
ncbi:hypothetical protein BDV06DRAFT_206557 [Aspergillus oleicola]